MAELRAVQTIDARAPDEAAGRRVGYDTRRWREAAACLHAGEGLFFPVGVTEGAAAQVRRAKAVCARCPVRRECLQFALTTNQEFGVWGGRDEEERRQLRRALRAGRGREL